MASNISKITTLIILIWTCSLIRRIQNKVGLTRTQQQIKSLYSNLKIIFGILFTCTLNYSLYEEIKYFFSFFLPFWQGKMTVKILNRHFHRSLPRASCYLYRKSMRIQHRINKQNSLSKGDIQLTKCSAYAFCLSKWPKFFRRF